MAALERNPAWVAVAGWPYDISSNGDVRSHRSGKLLKPWLNPRTGRLEVRLCGDSSFKNRPVHLIVAEAFLGPRPVGQEVRHLNGDRLDNRAANLAYGTRSENIRDAVQHGTHVNSSKTHCPKNHPYEGDNLYVNPQGHRYCNTCRRERRAG